MEYKQEFLQYLKARGFRPGTLVWSELYLDRFFSFLWQQGISQISAVNQEHIESYRSYVFSLNSKMTKQKLNVRTIFARLNIVKKYFRYLTDHGHLFIDPARNLVPPKAALSLPKNILNQEEIRLFLEKPDIKTDIGYRDRAILELFYCSGLRRQELVNLNLYDLDLPKRIIRINKGKNQKDRMIPIGKIATTFIEQYLSRIRPKWSRSSLESSLFITVYGGKLKPQTLNYTVKKYSDKVFPGRKVSCHTLRHTCATHLIREGANLRVIQELLGHSRIDTTQIYTRVSPIDLKAAHRKYHPRGKGQPAKKIGGSSAKS